MPGLGKKTWAIAEGYIPAWSHGPSPEMTSHEAACILNANGQDANVQIEVFFEDRDPVGPFRVKVRARRSCHLRFNEFRDPATIPPGTPFSTVFTSDVPIVVQHTRLDSRQAENALLSTMAFPGAE